MSLKLKAKAVLAIIVFAILFALFLANSRYFYLMSRNRNISAELLAIEHAQKFIPKEAYLYIDKNSGNPENIFAETRWLPYILRNQRFVFGDLYADGGYIYNVVKLEDLPEGTDIFAIKYNSRSKIEHHDMSVFSSGSYSIQKLDRLSALNIKGLYDKEPWGSWMADEVTIQSAGSCDINVPLLGKFDGIASDSVLIVKSLAGEDSYRSDGKEINIRIKTKSKDDVIVLKSSASSISPKSIGNSTDSRKLSFMIGDIYANNCITPELL